MRIGISLVVLALAAPFGCVEPAPAPTSENGGRQSTSLRLESDALELEGRPFDLWKGREGALATVVVFTKSDCPISNRYAPTIRSLCDAYRPQGVDFFLAYVDPQETADSVRRHQEEYQITCPGLRDPMHKLVALCGATVTPEAVVFDGRRKIAYRGRIDDLFVDFGQSRSEPTTHELADALDAVIAGNAVAPPVTKAVGCYIGDLR